MTSNTPLSRVLELEVSRKEFLVMLGGSLVSVLGFSSIIQLLSGKRLGRNDLTSSRGYNSGKYGQ